MLYLIIVFYTLFLLAFITWGILYVLPFFFGAPYVKSSDKRTKIVMKLLDPKKGEKIVDLGSGNGKILFEIAARGATAYGYEINPLLVWRTRWQAKRLGIDKNVKVYWKSFWDVDLARFDKIFLYQITYVMPGLEKKLKSELKPGTRIVSNYFKFPNMKPAKNDGDIYVYSSTSTLKSK